MCMEGPHYISAPLDNLCGFQSRPISSELLLLCWHFKAILVKVPEPFCAIETKNVQKIAEGEKIAQR